MIAVDTNILVYAHRKDSPFHKKAEALLRDCAQSSLSWAIAWPCLHEFYGIITHPRIYKTPTPRNMALAQIDNLIASPSLEILTETPDHWAVLKKIVHDGSIDGPKIHDARIAAICIENDITVLYTCDRDFSRFKELKTKNPF